MWKGTTLEVHVINRTLLYTLELCSYTFCWGTVRTEVPVVLGLERVQALSSCLHDRSYLPDTQEWRLTPPGKTQHCDAGWCPSLLEDLQSLQVRFHLVPILARVLSSTFAFKKPLVRTAFCILVSWLSQSEIQEANSDCISGVSFKATGWINSGSKQRRSSSACSPNLTSLVTVSLRTNICKEQLVMANGYEKLELAVWSFNIFNS